MGWERRILSDGALQLDGDVRTGVSFPPVGRKVRFGCIAPSLRRKCRTDNVQPRMLNFFRSLADLSLPAWAVWRVEMPAAAKLQTGCLVARTKLKDTE